MEKLNITVIGGSGFLGSHVADQMSTEGHIVKIYDNKASPWLREDQTMMIGDLLDFESLSKAIAGSDVVCNFAAIADLIESRDNLLDTIRINVLGNAYALDACRMNKVKRFVFASTVYVYSREGGFYRCSKQASEHFVEEYQRVHDLDYTILRFGSLYGPRSDERNGLYRIVRDALKNNIVSYEGDSEAMREYIHVEDAARASVVALGDDFRNQSVVLTGQEPMRVNDLLNMLAEILGIKEGVKFLGASHEGRYVRTPYSYQPKLGRKYIPPMHVDLGQGLLQLIGEISQQIKKL
ncbi:MAG: NAD-dependent epimerase [Nitrosomonadaceae bacterium]|nr:NAD-dependent epimerase [Nitrosomonadaceae bacterium]|tara:strand:+ start:1854 stop:2738 length:885 start_codon:yes stop_codon:yes gene_type:complete